MNAFDAGDLQTETFSNSRGWMTVRVTHGPSAIVVERSKTDALRSAVQAQRECIEEIRKLVAGRRWPERGEDAPAPPAAPARTRPSTDSSSELAQLASRVAQLEERITELEAITGQQSGIGRT